MGRTAVWQEEYARLSQRLQSYRRLERCCDSRSWVCYIGASQRGVAIQQVVSIRSSSFRYHHASYGDHLSECELLPNPKIPHCFNAEHRSQKALNLFNAALVTPTYYVFFTSATIVTSAILFQGFKGTVVTITTVVLGFLQICSGVVLLQLSKSAKDVPDAAVFKGDLDQVREVAEQEQPETEPKADALRGTAAIIRRISMSRQKMEEEEARRLREEKRQDQMEPIGENEVVEWDGIRRRKTIINSGPSTFPQPQRRKTLHPPLGMSHFPTESEIEFHHDNERDTVHFFENIRHRAQHAFSPGLRKTPSARDGDDSRDMRSPMHPVALTEIAVPKGGRDGDTPIRPYGPGSLEEAQEHIYGLPSGLIKEKDRANPASTRHLSPPKADTTSRPSPSSRRQFSFQNVFHRAKSTDTDPEAGPTTSQTSRSRATSNSQRKAAKTATEEERLGLVKGDSNIALPLALARSDSSSTTTSSTSSLVSRTNQPHYYDKNTDTSYHAPPAAASSYYTSSRSRDNPSAYEEIDDDDTDSEEWQIASRPESQHSQSSPQLRQRPLVPLHGSPPLPQPPPHQQVPQQSSSRDPSSYYERLQPPPASSFPSQPSWTERPPQQRHQSRNAGGVDEPPLTAFRRPEEIEREERRIRFEQVRPPVQGKGERSGGGDRGGAFI